ncbi:MAG: IS5 family transposase [Proteobacteria bacterium]|nr:IS5 family transposase [Pseudomonadota bacterium]
MKPKSCNIIPQDDLFRMRLDNMLDMKHELITLSGLIDWGSFDEQWGQLFLSHKGAPAIRTRLIAGLHYLKHIHNLSDEEVVRGWVENPYWQYFCGEEYFQHKMPLHPTSLTTWRNRLGETLLKETIKTELKSKTITPNSLNKVTVDTTVQEKNITFPTDSKLLNKVRDNLVKIAAKHRLPLRQNYNRKGPQYALMATRYAHAKQYKRMKKMNNKLRSRLGRVMRDIERQLSVCSEETQAAFNTALAQAKQLIAQERSSKNKLYSLHAPEVECISKGKAHKLYEFGVKASIAVTNKEGFVVGAQSCPGNPYDGHTLKPQLQQVEKLTSIMPEYSFVDRGYRGHGVTETKVFISGQKRGVTRSIKKALKRRSAVEPEIGHMKNEGRLGCCYLKGSVGDAMNVIMVGAGHNLRKILNKLRLLWLKIMSCFFSIFYSFRTE